MKAVDEVELSGKGGPVERAISQGVSVVDQVGGRPQESVDAGTVAVSDCGGEFGESLIVAKAFRHHRLKELADGPVVSVVRHFEQLVPRVVGVARLSRISAFLEQHLNDVRVPLSGGHVNGKLVPVLRIDEIGVPVEEIPDARQVTGGRGAEQGPCIPAIHRYDTVDIALGIHRFGLAERGDAGGETVIS